MCPMDEAAHAWDVYCAHQEEQEQAMLNEFVERYSLSLPLTCGQCYSYCDYEHKDVCGFKHDGVCVELVEEMPVSINGVDKDTEACKKFTPLED